MTTLHLETALECRVHPLVVVSVLDHFARRKEGQTRVIGALLGRVAERAVEITDSFPVPHSEGKDVRLDFDFHNFMRDIHRRTGPHEQMVGWYATGAAVTESSAVINEFYRREIKTMVPVHLTVDPSNAGAISAYTCSNAIVNSHNLGSYFQPLRCVRVGSELERVGVNVLSRAKSTAAPLPLSEANSMDSEYNGLLGALDSAISYVRAVAEGKVEGDPEIGREISAVAQLLPLLEAGELDKLLSESLQDVLMVAYVAKLMKAQLGIAERLRNALASPAVKAAAAASSAVPQTASS